MKTVKLLMISAVLIAFSNVDLQAAVLVYEGFGDVATEGDSIGGYSGSSAELGLTGSWSLDSGSEEKLTVRSTAEIDRIPDGYEPEYTGGAQHWWETNGGWNQRIATRSLASSINLSTNGTFYIGWFMQSSDNDIIEQVGLSNSTNELMVGNAYQGASNKGLTAYYGANGTGPQTNCDGTDITYSGSYATGVFVVKLTKTNSGTTDDLAVDIIFYDLSTDTVDSSDPASWDRTVNLTGVTGTFDTLKLKLDGGWKYNGMDEIRIGHSWLDVTDIGAKPNTPVVVQTEDAVNGDVDAVFTWNAAEDDEGVHATDPNIVRQDVYLTKNLNTISTDPNLYYIGSDTTVNLADPASQYPETGHHDLDFDGSYQWTVVSVINTGGQEQPNVGDRLMDMTDPNNVVGPTWNFDALASVPVINEQPVDVVDVPGDSVSLAVSVSSISAEHYQWYKSADNANDTPGDDATVGSDANTLTFNPLAVADEGYYYCLVYNDATVSGGQGGTAPDVLSNVARVGVNRQLAYWTLDSLVGDQYVDSGTEDPVADNIDPNNPAGVAFVSAAYPALGNAVAIDPIYSFGAVATDPNRLDVTRFTDEMTITAWIRLTGDAPSGDGAGILVKGDGNAKNAANYRWTFYVRDRGTNLPSVRLLSWNGLDAWSDPNAVPSNEWVHVAATINDGVADVYVNGKQSGYGDGTPTLGNDADGPVRLGDYGPAGFKFPGDIDDVAIYNYGMTDKEMIDLYNATPAPDVWECLNPDLIDETFDAVDDCKIDLKDFAIFALTWLDCGRYPVVYCN